jgi:hypothetical protein
MKKIIAIIAITILILIPMMSSIDLSLNDIAAPGILLAILGTWLVLTMNFSRWFVRYFRQTTWFIISSAIIITTMSLLAYIFFFLDHQIKHSVAHDADFITNALYISLLFFPFATSIFIFQSLIRVGIDKTKAQCISEGWTIVTGALSPFLMFIVACIYAGTGF